ncbi:serine hydrolase domain-containing protein [Nocardia sp. NPDC050406]|uniref:serine hydrolase domain-containing protein n=1 Tax=Nocardia sp. NPDC050406 TaxID=3364318 RepID=UPI0037A31FD0
MSDIALSDFVAATATTFNIPGVSVAVFADGREIFAAHGVTSVDNPVPVDEHTLFAIGSVTKTVTATAIMRLAAEGKIDLEAPVRRYVPELTLRDERIAAQITVRHLLNHTSGLDWGMINETGEGDDGLAEYVATLSELALIGEPGERASYSQGGFNLLGHIIEKVTGQTYEKAVSTLIFEPVGLTDSLFGANEILTRRFAVGHEIDADGGLSVVTKWKGTRANNPGGGLGSSAADGLRWARFHLGDGRTDSGATVLPTEVLHRMREQTVELRGSSLGDGFGLGWFLREIDGAHAFGHGGSSFGQFAELLIVPERNFAVFVASNANPDGIPCNQAIVRWALEHYAGLIDRDPEPLPYDAQRAQEVVGHYENEIMNLDIVTDGAELTLEVVIKPEIRAASDEAMPADHLPFVFGLLPGDGDEYMITAGAFAGQRGFFSRDENGAVTGVDLAGRLFARVS